MKAYINCPLFPIEKPVIFFQWDTILGSSRICDPQIAILRPQINCLCASLQFMVLLVDIFGVRIGIQSSLPPISKAAVDSSKILA